MLTFYGILFCDLNFHSLNIAFGREAGWEVQENLPSHLWDLSTGLREVILWNHPRDQCSQPTPWCTDAETMETGGALCLGQGPAIKGRTGLERPTFSTKDSSLWIWETPGCECSVQQKEADTLWWTSSTWAGRAVNTLCSDRYLEEVISSRDYRNCACQCLSLNSRYSTLVLWLGRDRKVKFHLTLKGTGNEGKLEMEYYPCGQGHILQVCGSS